MIPVDKDLNVKWNIVTSPPRVGLDFGLAGRDMHTFDIHRAHIPSSLFKDIIGDLQVIMKQYGEPVRHKNEEARSRFLAPVSARGYPPPL